MIGEERALINALNGGPGKPTFAPPRPFQKGIGGAPTLVQNAETAAQLALIARHGAEWFRGLGTAAEPGSALVTLTGAVAHPGVYEIPLGAALDDLVAAAGGLAAPVRAYLIGGYFGTWIDAADAPGLRLTNADLARLGGGLGARAIIALPASACGVTETARVARCLSGQSAGQCGPCVHGLDAIAGAMELLARGDGRQLPDLAALAADGARPWRLPAPGRERQADRQRTRGLRRRGAPPHRRPQVQRRRHRVLPIPASAAAGRPR